MLQLFPIYFKHDSCGEWRHTIVYKDFSVCFNNYILSREEQIILRLTYNWVIGIDDNWIRLK